MINYLVYEMSKKKKKGKNAHHKVQNPMTLHLVSQIANPYIEEDKTSKCFDIFT